jgi:hypothetical protein
MAFDQGSVKIRAVPGFCSTDYRKNRCKKIKKKIRLYGLYYAHTHRTYTHP